jgi:hypothetical protein
VQQANRWRQVLAWMFLALVAASASFCVYLSYVACPPANEGSFNDTRGGFVVVLSSLAFAIIGVLIVTFRPENRIGWLCAICGILQASFMPVTFIAACPAGDAVLLQPGTASWLINTFSLPLILLPEFVLLPLWFPNGQFLSPRWRLFWYLILAMAVIYMGTNAVWPEIRDADFNLIPNPVVRNFGPPGWLVALWPVIPIPVVILPALIANGSLFVRYRRSDSVTRQQLRVFALIAISGATLLLVVQGFAFIISDFLAEFDLIYTLVLIAGWLGYPVAIGVGVLRYHLYNIDVIIRKTLVYGILTASLALLYFGLVTLLQALSSSVFGLRSPVIIVLSTLAIAALFNPLRKRIQDFIDRRFYRKKYDAEKALARFAEAARNETDLECLNEALLEVVQETMEPVRVSIWLRK